MQQVQSYTVETVVELKRDYKIQTPTYTILWFISDQTSTHCCGYQQIYVCSSNLWNLFLHLAKEATLIEKIIHR